MPYPARTTTDDPGTGRHATAKRGCSPPQSGRINDDGRVAPVRDPVGSVATTGLIDLKPGPTSRLTRRSKRSLSGDSYSQRAPAVIVSAGPTRQSSVTYASYEKPLRYLSALPYAIWLVAGMPSRKSAKSAPDAAPVNANPPRGSCCDRMSAWWRRTPPQIVKLCRPRLTNASPPPPFASLRVNRGSASASPEMPRGKLRLGGPQFTGCWLLPLIPASPETFVRYAKYGLVSLVWRGN